MAKVLKRKADIESKVRKQVALEERAHQWVEKVSLTDCIDMNELNEMVNQIMVSHYKDIIEERSISNFCGYPLCCNVLPKVKKQQYHISMKLNKVFDITEQKLFCSLGCFKASKHIENQIPESPLWLRSSKVVVEIADSQEKNSQSILNRSDIAFDFGRLTLEDCDSTCSNNRDLNKHNTEENKNLLNGNYVDNSKVGENEADDNQFPDDVLNSREDDEDEDNKFIDQLCEQIHEKSVKTYRSIKLTDTLENPENFKYTQKRPAKSDKLIETTINNEQNEISIVEKLDELSGRLSEWFTGMSYCYFKTNKTSLNKDMCTEEGSNFYGNVMNFFSTNPSWVKDLGEENCHNRKPVLPDCNKTSQSSIRKTYMKNKIQNSMNKISNFVGTTSNVNLDDVGFYQLIDTFKLTSKNVILAQDDWMLMTLYLLMIFSVSGTATNVLSGYFNCLSPLLQDKYNCSLKTLEQYGQTFLKDFMFENEVEYDTSCFPYSNDLEDNSADEKYDASNMEELD